MKLSTKGRYGTRILLDLALNQGEELVLLRDIARRQAIPLPYVKQLIGPLTSGGLLRSSRGVGGGVFLARRPEQIRLNEIIELLEGPITAVECVKNPELCPRSDFCAPRDVWSELSKAMNEVLEATTLQDLVERQRRKEHPEAVMYQI